MQLPFTTEQFFQVFRDYNGAVWPAQGVLLALAMAAVVLLFVRRPWAGAAIATVLAVLWAWLGLAYHLAFFARINPLAYVFAGVSVAGAAMFLWLGVVRRRLEFGAVRSGRALGGALLLVYALLAYPVWSTLAGHGYPALPTFGLPCPTTLFTIGMLAFLKPPHPRGPLLVPVLWSFVGAQAAFLLNVDPDVALVPAGVFGVFLMMRAKSEVSSSGTRR